MVKTKTSYRSRKIGFNVRCKSKFCHSYDMTRWKLPQRSPLKNRLDIAQSKMQGQISRLAVHEDFKICKKSEMIEHANATDSGILRAKPGQIQKSIVKKETHSVTSEQALWRLKNWKLMIANYRRRGYSYPTIMRIKNSLKSIS